MFGAVFCPASFYGSFGASLALFIRDVVKVCCTTAAAFLALFKLFFFGEKLAVSFFSNFDHFIKSFLLESIALARGLIYWLSYAIIKVGILCYLAFLGGMTIFMTVSPLELIFISFISILPPFSSLLIFYCLSSCYSFIIHHTVHKVKRFLKLFCGDFAEFSTGLQMRLVDE